jgi:3'(2'), 5'-bisphosphate nucleotidase
MSAGAPAELLPRVTEIARRAGAAILEVYASGDSAAQSKSDSSPLTAADLRSHRLIVAALRELTPDIPVLSEEGAATPFGERSGWRRYWLVDPLDGTREFLARNGQFTVNIALIEEHTPVLGVVQVPVSDTAYQGVTGVGAWRQTGSAARVPIRVQARAVDPVRVVGSRSHRGDSLDAFLERLGTFELKPIGSSLKFCLVAEGSADVYPRLGPTSEWDTAAAHAVAAAAGAGVVQLDGEPLRYNDKAELINPFFVVYGDAHRDWLGLLR